MADIGPVLRIDRVSKAFGGKPAVSDVSFDVQRGDIVGFLGPNGAGKTTVMSMVAGLLRPDVGEIELLGAKNGARHKEVRARVGFLQEKPRIYPDMTARNYLSLFSDLYGVADPRARVDTALEQVDLADAPDRPMRQFSRGMQQRVCLARVLLHQPEFLILDEPTLGLDPHGVAQMRDIFAGLKANGVTLLFSSHQLAEMERVCDHIVLMQGGEVIASGPQRDLLSGDTAIGVFTVELAETDSDAKQILAGLAHVSSVEDAGDGAFRIALEDEAGSTTQQKRMRLSQDLTKAGLTVLSVSRGMLSLEDLFLRLTSGSRAT